MNPCKGWTTSLSLVLLLVLQWTVAWGKHGKADHHHKKRQPPTDQQEPPSKFHDANIVHDTDHIKEHYEGIADIDEDKMSVEELEFHYFKLHDFDNNTMLDGLEMFKALTHMLPYEDIKDDLPDSKKPKMDKTKQTEEEVEMEQMEAKMNYYADIIDTVLTEDDIDNDGYLSYAEYVMARRREEKKAKDGDTRQ